jgi:hypothetical protein
MPNRKGRPPMVVNYAQNQTFEESGNHIGVLARPGDEATPDDADLPRNGYERLRNDRVRIYWMPIDWEDMSRKGEIVESIVDENKWVDMYDPDLCPRNVIHIYPDFVTEQPDSIMRTQDPDQVTSLGVMHQYLLYEKVETQDMIQEYVQKSPDRMSQFVDQISNEFSEDQLLKLKKQLDALDLEVKKSSSSSSDSDSS